MLESAVDEYIKYIDIHLEQKLHPINQSIDEMLNRLEEFETIMVLVQQERCNAIGLTGALIESVDCHKEMKELCARIDTLEKLIDHIKLNVDMLEKKMEQAEEQFGIGDSTNKLKNFFLPLFKKSSSETKMSSPTETPEPLNVQKYFSSDDE